MFAKPPLAFTREGRTSLFSELPRRVLPRKLGFRQIPFSDFVVYRTRPAGNRLFTSVVEGPGARRSLLARDPLNLFYPAPLTTTSPLLRLATYGGSWGTAFHSSCAARRREKGDEERAEAPRVNGFGPPSKKEEEWVACGPSSYPLIGLPSAQQ